MTHFNNGDYEDTGSPALTTCSLCGEPMPQGEQMFKYHGYSGPCPKPPLLKEARGLFDKFTVIRNDGGSDVGRKHHGCEYFVLDMMHDKHTVAALLAYAESCKEEYPKLADDLRAKAASILAKI